MISIENEPVVSESDHPSPIPSPEIVDDKENIEPETSKTNVVVKKRPLETSQEDLLVSMFNFISKTTGLLFGVDLEIEPLEGKKRIRKQPSISAGADLLKKEGERTTPRTVSSGYGEITKRGFQKLLDYMQSPAIDEELRLNENSTFIDIGSGYGKCVFHTVIASPVQKACGIEFIRTRSVKAYDALQFLQIEHPEQQQLWKKIQFQEGDATTYDSFPYTHIYCFDYVFEEETHKKLTPILLKSDFKVLICFTSPKKLLKYASIDSPEVEVFHKISVTTTGRQNFTGYFYRKKQQ